MIRMLIAIHLRRTRLKPSIKDRQSPFTQKTPKPRPTPKPTTLIPQHPPCEVAQRSKRPGPGKQVARGLFVLRVFARLRNEVKGKGLVQAWIFGTGFGEPFLL